MTGDIDSCLWGSRPESLKVSGLGLQRCSLQVWCWFVSMVLDFVEVERQLDLSSVAARLRGVLVLFVRNKAERGLGKKAPVGAISFASGTLASLPQVLRQVVEANFVIFEV
ncbi:hypothetical protein Taro_023248 [Colocasia esculenta]|uniref:Uncharacterized protein n=1 Tax=Colocasia esculenta TaxID=4460 RepID=A0A843V5W2_COLES|nr:hypothetical protein [Colocasia esculenta]